VDDRDVGIYFYRGPTLELETPTPLQTRLGVTLRNADTLFLSRLFGRSPMARSNPGLDDLTVFALDEVWAERLLAQQEAVALIRRLIAFEGSFTRRNLILQPGLFRLSLFGNRNLFKYDLPERPQEWVEDFVRLVTIAEGLPAPQVTAEESSAERFARSLRGST